MEREGSLKISKEEFRTIKAPEGYHVIGPIIDYFEQLEDRVKELENRLDNKSE